jgi:hypothetical protein
MPKGYKKTPAEELYELLLKAHKQIRPKKGNRYAYVMALKSVGYFLRTGKHKECAEWIEGLATQLQDAEITGHVGADLRRTKKSGNTPRLLDQQLRQFVAAGVKFLIEDGASRKKAAKQAIKKVDAIRELPTTTILSWMDELGKKRHRGASLLPYLVKPFLGNQAREIADKEDITLSDYLESQAEACFQIANDLGKKLTL